jgi:heptosyltransferase-2
MSLHTENSDRITSAYRSGMGVEIAAIAGTARAEKTRKNLLQAKRVVVVTKFKFMGDTIVATPMLRQLRTANPQAHLTLLTSHSAAAALQDFPYLDAVQGFDQGHGLRIHHTLDLVNLLREGSYDVAFLLNRSVQCAVAVQWAGIPTRIGYKGECRTPFLTLAVPYSFDRNESTCLLDMVRAVGLPVKETLPELTFSEHTRKRAYELLASFGWSAEEGGRPLIGMQPGANDPYIREWGAKRYATVADTLIEEWGATVVLMGGKEEEATAQEMERQMRHPVLNLIGKSPLRESLAMIGHCNLWIGNDSGLLHTAVAQGVPSVGIYGPNKVVRWGYHTARHRSLVAFPDRPAETDDAIRSCLDQIPVTDVLSAIEEVMQSSATPLHEDSLCPYFTATKDEAQRMATRRR